MAGSPSRACPYCEPASERVFHHGALVRAFWASDEALVVTRRHVASLFESLLEERTELWAAVDVALHALRDRHGAAVGYKIAVEIGAGAGQVVPHLCVRVVPCLPAEGVRDDGHVYRRDAPRSAYDFEEARSALVRGDDDHLLPRLEHHAERAERVDICVAFVLRSGVDALEPVLLDLLRRGGRLRVLTGDYLDTTDPTALRRLIDLEAAASSREQLVLRVFEARQRAFHPKAYMFHFPGRQGLAFVGSSNLSRAALRDSVEWNYRVVPSRDQAGFAAIVEAFESLFSSSPTRPLTHAWVDEYERRRRVHERPVEERDEPIEPPPQIPTPNDVQLEALDELGLTRDAGNNAGLVVLATGIGKTWLAAFDSLQFSRVLFVAHRQEILSQALQTFRRIRPSSTFGLFTGEEKASSAEVVFASVQTLGRPEHLERFAPDEFDYVVVDEFHHADAETYKRIIRRFTPAFMLGLTATPERSDGGNLLALCQENLVYSCGVDEGIGRGLLCPFHYFGVADTVDYENIRWRSTRFDPDELTRHVATEARATSALEQYRAHGQARTIAFCCSTRHADFMTDWFARAGLRAVSVHSGERSAPRAESLQMLRDGQIDVIFAVDMFNEGVDVPSIDTVMMLRPTESRGLWMQQFGRGLRFSRGKTLHVIDFVGNHRTFLTPLQVLFDLGANPLTLSAKLAELERSGGEVELSNGCHVTYDLTAIDLLQGLARVSKKADAFGQWVVGFRELRGRRPTALEAYHEGFDPRGLPKTLRPWFAALQSFDLLDSEERRLLEDEEVARLLESIQDAETVRSRKIVLLLAWLDGDGFPAPIDPDRLTRPFYEVAHREGAVALDLNVDLDDARALRAVVADAANDWAESDLVRIVSGVQPRDRQTLQAMLRELAEWQLAAHLYRRRLDRIHAVIDGDGRELDAHFTTERAGAGFAVIIESRGGTSGSKAARNTEYGPGLRILLERLKRLGARLDGVELATKQVSGDIVALKHHAYPVDLRTLTDADALRRDIQAGQGNNPTRRIRLLVSGISERSTVKVHRRLASG